jgi:hypothetical protein
MKAFFVADKVPPQYLRDGYVAGAFARVWRDDQGSCTVRLVQNEALFPDAQLKIEGACLDLEITMALDKDKKMFEEWSELRDKAKRGEFVLAKTFEQRRASALEAIPRRCKEKSEKQYATPPTLVIHTDDGLAISAEEMAHLTEPWKDRFAAIYLLCGMDAVMAWPELRVLRGKEPF